MPVVGVLVSVWCGCLYVRVCAAVFLSLGCVCVCMCACVSCSVTELSVCFQDRAWQRLQDERAAHTGGRAHTGCRGQGDRGECVCVCLCVRVRACDGGVCKGGVCEARVCVHV